MKSTRDRNGTGAAGGRSSWRMWAILLGGLIVFVVAFDLLEGLVTPERPPGAELSSDPAAAPGPIRPVVEKLEDGSVQVRVGLQRRVTIHFDEEGDADALVACLEEGFASSAALIDGEAAQPPVSNGLIARHLRAQQVWEEVSRIQDACLLTIPDAPLPPRLPTH